MANSNLNKARKAQRDEFYTPLQEIEKEVKHYREHFKGKSVYLNCDDYKHSEFWRFFVLQFDILGLKKLTATCYKEVGLNVKEGEDSRAYKAEYCGSRNETGIPDEDEIQVTYLKGNGDFRSEECISILEECDIVVTNPPFSLLREFVPLIVEYNKDFLFIGNLNIVTFKEIFPLIKNGEIWLGENRGKMLFRIPDSYEIKESATEYIDGERFAKFNNIRWFTNLPVLRFEEELFLFRSYKDGKVDYPKYDNYNAIEVSKVADIPYDFEGYMGVPITFLDKYNPKQFEIIGKTNSKHTAKGFFQGNDPTAKIGGVKKYHRILIKNLHPTEKNQINKK